MASHGHSGHFRSGGYGGRYNRSPSCIYVGNLPEDIREREVEDIFYKFGRIRDLDLKRGRTTNGTSYCFIEFDSVRDAEEAVRRRDGYSFSNTRLRVEFTGERRPRRHNENSFGGPPKRSDYRVLVTNLPSGCRWQHLKDHMRQAGDVGFANVEYGRGVVEYSSYEDMQLAISRLDGSTIVASEDSSVIRVKANDSSSNDGYRNSGSDNRRRRQYRSRSRSRSPSRSRSVGRGSKKSEHGVKSRLSTTPDSDYAGAACDGEKKARDVSEQRYADPSMEDARSSPGVIRDTRDTD